MIASLARRLATVILLFVIGTSVRAQRPDASAIPGTYALVVCKLSEGARCSVADTASAVAWGTLVLLPDTVPWQAPPLSQSHRLEPVYLAPGTANACFRMARRGNTTLAGAMGQASTRWQVDSTGAVTIALFRSPDTWHSARLVVRGDSLLGRGAGSSGLPRPDGQPWVPPPDTLVAVRRGPPNAAACVRRWSWLPEPPA